MKGQEHGMVYDCNEYMLDIHMCAFGILSVLFSLLRK